jgi:hypothetical protein
MKIVKTSQDSYGPCKDYRENPDLYGEQLYSHIEAHWTFPDHFLHDNYQRGHLPQLCIHASGWKAKILAFIFRAKR